ncbi:IclR family transcriptional regulator, partial [Rhodococcus hoagii]|nr:IclR family transcriptional regulator [Prescottella equi]
SGRSTPEQFRAAAAPAVVAAADALSADLGHRG